MTLHHARRIIARWLDRASQGDDTPAMLELTDEAIEALKGVREGMDGRK